MSYGEHFPSVFDLAKQQPPYQEVFCVFVDSAEINVDILTPYDIGKRELEKLFA